MRVTHTPCSTSFPDVCQLKRADVLAVVNSGQIIQSGASSMFTEILHPYVWTVKTKYVTKTQLASPSSSK